MTKAFFVVLPVTDPGVTDRPPEPAGFKLTQQGGRWVLYYGLTPDMQPIPDGGLVRRSPRRRDVRPYVWLDALLTDPPNSRAFFVVVGDDLRMLRYLKGRADAAGFKSWTKAELAADNAPLATYIKNNVSPEDRAALRRVFAGDDPGALDTTAVAEIDEAGDL